MLAKLHALKQAATESSIEEELHLSEEQIEEFREAFALFDKSGDGLVNIKEMQVIMRSIGQNPSEEEILNIMIDVDPRAATT
jgi:Ca2+-binding EF-hand superfamily protein